MVFVLTSWKKKVALFACRAACESAGPARCAVSFWGGRIGVAESFLMSYGCSVSEVQTRAVSSPCLVSQSALGQTDASTLNCEGERRRTFLSAL